MTNDEEIRKAEQALIKAVDRFAAGNESSYSDLIDARDRLVALLSPLPSRDTLDQLGPFGRKVHDEDMGGREMEVAGAYWMQFLAALWRNGYEVSPEQLILWAKVLKARE